MARRMTDFEQDVREKKNIAASAKHKRASARGPRGCTLPSDYLTPAQKKKLNGPVTTYRLDVPMKWEEFKALPVDAQVDYLRYLLAAYGANDKMLARMFEVSPPTVARYRKEFGFAGAGRGGACHGRGYELQQERWLEFIAGADESDCAEEEETAVTEEVTREELPCGTGPDVYDEQEAPVESDAEPCVLRMDKFETTITGQYSPEVMRAVLGTLPCVDGKVVIHIEVSRID